ncbi:MAG TPA: hypothetical protein VH590_15760 [Ktedonobacterales bacterium]|jgi:hypothetical protein
MVSSRLVPWYARPSRPFPALVWLAACYGFRVPRSSLAWAVVHTTSDGVTPRPFPAKVWLEQRWQQGG